MEKIEDQIKKLPDEPGIYFFKKGRQILYIGKATSLRSRVRSYFRGDIVEARSPWIAQMISQVDKVDFEPTDSVLEALILESAEIKKHQPLYNTREKDDKSYLYVVITDEDFPKILSVRGKNFPKDENSRVFTPEEPHADKNFHFRSIFGPFPYGSELRKALKIIRKIFPYRDKCIPNSGKPCFNAQIGLCPGVCFGAISQRDYGKTIRHLKLFFEGKKAKLIKQLEQEMKACAKKQEFEKAGEFKRQIFALNHIQDVALIKRENQRSDLKNSRGLTSVSFRIEAYDIAHLSGKNTVGAMVVMQDGELDKNSYRKFKLRGVSAEKSDDVGNLKEILERRFKHLEWTLPNLVVVDGGVAQINVAKMVLQNLSLNIPIVGVVKDEHHKAREIIGATDHGDQVIHLNQEAHRFVVAYHRSRRVLY